MSLENIDKAALILDVYVRLRRSGFRLGVDDYMAGLSLVGDRASALPFGTDWDSLNQSLKLIWCSSRSERGQFEPIWKQALEAAEQSSLEVIEEEDKREPLPPPDFSPGVPSRNPIESVRPELTEKPPVQAVGAAAQPVRAPFTPAEIEHPSDLQRYWPVSRRSMSYSWRYLRRNVSEGPATDLDVAATVQQAAQQGFYLKPVMQQRDHNRAQLLLLLDQNGSMMPMHQFTREMAETALHESNLSEEQVTVCYFHNFPTESVYKDIFLTERVALASVLAACDGDTSVLIVSDGGAARGHRRLDRIRGTTKFLRQLRRTTQLCAWLNPMPLERWRGSSAEVLANLVPMFQMDDDGLSNAIDVARGLQVQAL